MVVKSILKLFILGLVASLLNEGPCWSFDGPGLIWVVTLFLGTLGVFLVLAPLHLNLPEGSVSLLVFPLPLVSLNFGLMIIVYLPCKLLFFFLVLSFHLFDLAIHNLLVCSRSKLHAALRLDNLEGLPAVW